MASIETIVCINCAAVVPRTGRAQRFCPTCSATRNRDKHREDVKRSYDKDPTPARARALAYYYANTERARALTRQWHIDHPERVIEHRQRASQKRRELRTATGTNRHCSAAAVELAGAAAGAVLPRPHAPDAAASRDFLRCACGSLTRRDVAGTPLRCFACGKVMTSMTSPPPAA